MARIRRKILSEQEKTETHGIPPLDLWVAKEAYLKLTGEGLAGGMHNYTIAEGAVRDRQGMPRARLMFAPLPGYRIAVCCHAPFVTKMIPIN